MKSRSAKIVASIAVVGTVAAIAAFVTNKTSVPSTRFLAQAESFKPEEVEAFQTFITKYNRNYLTKEEYNARLAVFKENMDLVKSHDAKKTGFTIALNKFSDLSVDEFKKRNGFKPPSVKFHDDEDHETHGKDHRNAAETSLPTSIDWREKGAVTSVKNQGQCGGCYTFSAAHAMEGIYKIKYGQLIDFSEQ